MRNRSRGNFKYTFFPPSKTTDWHIFNWALAYQWFFCVFNIGRRRKNFDTSAVFGIQADVCIRLDWSNEDSWEPIYIKQEMLRCVVTFTWLSGSISSPLGRRSLDSRFNPQNVIKIKIGKQGEREREGERGGGGRERERYCNEFTTPRNIFLDFTDHEKQNFFFTIIGNSENI